MTLSLLCKFNEKMCSQKICHNNVKIKIENYTSSNEKN